MCWFLYWRLLDWRRSTPRPFEPGIAPVDPARVQAKDLPVLSPSIVEPAVIPPEVPEPNIPRPIEAHEEAILKTCFAWNVFFLEKIEYRPQAVLCRGKLRTDPDTAYATLKHNVEDLFGDRFFILFQYSLSTGKPFFALVPRPQPTLITGSRRWLDEALAIGLLLLTLIPTTYFGAALAQLPQGDIGEILHAGLPYSLSIISIQIGRAHV